MGTFHMKTDLGKKFTICGWGLTIYPVVDGHELEVMHTVDPETYDDELINIDRLYAYFEDDKSGVFADIVEQEYIFDEEEEA